MGLSAEVVHCPMKCISQYPSYSWSVWKKPLWLFVPFLGAMPVLCMPRAVAAYEYNQSGLMHMQPFSLKYCNFWGVSGTESWAGGQRQLHSRSEVQQSSLLGKSMLFYVWYGTVAGTSNVHHKHSSLTMQSTTAAALFCHAGRDALIEQCFSWELIGNHDVQWVK